MNSSQSVRKQFIEFFNRKNHLIVSSAPIVQKDDPTLMFTNSGMAQFKDVFLDLKSPQAPRIADTQKCMRVSGKHNDLEDVGHDTYHHTMFEMLGNWSFGDYYKKEAIDWAWELLIDGFGLDPKRLYATVFGGDEGLKLGLDDEAEGFWKKYLPTDHILRAGRKDNFWMMGEIGPCGPCSEIHYDLRSDEERAETDGASLVNEDHPQVVEIWNLVFMQYNAKTDGSLEPLPNKHVDTGMGFERLLMVLQGKSSTYDTDLFDPLRDFLKAKTGIDYFEADHKQQVALRVVMDHIRSIAFAIADGQVPSNTGAGYVIRRILRRAARYAYTFLGIKEPFMYKMTDELVKVYDGFFPELDAQHSFLRNIIEQEEKSFLEKLARGTKMFDDYIASHEGVKVIDGDFTFKLYDTFGFPKDLTQLMARERGLDIDSELFEKNLQAQKERSRAATTMKAGDWVEVRESEDLPIFRGYDVLDLETRILRMRTVEAKGKNLYQIVLEETPFYAESGGQIGDKGTLTNGDETIKVLDTKKENELIVHFVNKLPEDASGFWKASVYAGLRETVTLNHSATHLMHAALRDVLGTHVEQRGSLVSEKLLRFDFSHFQRVSEEELAKVEDIVNERIAQGINLTEYRDMPIDDAKAMGAMALFGEKYGDSVRVIVFDQDFSVELCGGTHVSNTRDIRLFKFTSEGSSAAGIRRVEAITGKAALAHLNKQVAQLDAIKASLKGAKDPVKAIETMLEQQKALEKELSGLRAEKVGQLKEGLLSSAETINELAVIRAKVDVPDGDSLKQLSFDLRAAVSEPTLVVLAAEIGGKAILSIILSDDLAEGGKLHAGNMVRELAKSVKGGGGGQPFYATAGGKDPSGIATALQRVEEFV
ncbi:MAG: alanine--tRNA ligase [Bacteroidia bacterium]